MITHAKSRRYHRATKPPYTYVSLIALAIKSSKDKRMPLNEIVERIGQMFPLVHSGHTGWRDSIRHTLSKYECFEVDHDFIGDPFMAVHRRGNFWKVNISKMSSDKFLRKSGTIDMMYLPSSTDFVDDLRHFFDFEAGTAKFDPVKIELNSETGIEPIMKQDRDIDTDSLIAIPLTELVTKLSDSRHSQKRLSPWASKVSDERSTQMDFVLEKASIPFTIDALVILCFKSLGVWAADEITIAGHLQVLFPSMTFDVRIPCHGYTLLRNVSSHNGHACYVPNFLIEQVRVVFRRNPTIFSLPRGLESTKESLPHCIVWSAIQPNSTVLAKVRDSSNLLSNSFVESLSDILFSDINFFGMNADQIRKLLIKSENTFEIQKFLAEKHFSSPLITVNSPLPLTTAPLYSRASF